MTSEKLASVLSIGVILVAVVGLLVHVLVVFFRDRKDLRQRLARAKQRREENEQTARELYIEVLTQERARDIVAAQRQDITPISVPVTRCEYLYRRRILRTEE
jgi:hypothetical protein